MEKRIFISHSSKDAQTATIICDALESNGMKCWIAPRDIPYGQEWAGEISKAITNSSAFLFLSSGNSNASGQVSREIQLAIENQVPIIPIRLDGAEYSDTNKYYLATIHCMFQYDASKVAKLVTDITKALPDSAIKAEEQEKKKEKKVKKPRHGLKLTLSTVFFWLCTALAAYLVLFSGLGTAVKIIGAVAAVVVGFVPMLIVRKKAIKSFALNRTTLNAVLILALVAAIGIGAGAVVLENHLWYSDMEHKYHITLTAPDYMTASEFDDACKKVEDRLNILADGQRYSFEIEGDKIDLVIPFEIFGEETANDMIKCYISRAQKFYLTKATYEVLDPAQVEITPADIESVQLLKGKIPGEPEIDEENVVDKENYDYIKVTLKKDFVEANRDAIELYGDGVVFAADKVEIGNNYYYYHTFKGETEYVYYILGDKQSSVNEVFLHNLTSDPLAYSLNVSIDVAADWEKASEGAVFGKNQKEYKEIKGETISIGFRASEYSAITEGSWLDAVSNLKKRLDSLGEPYTFGYGINDPHLIVVKMSPEKLTYGLIQALCADGIVFRAGYNEAYVPTSYSNNKYVELIELDGTPAIKINALYDSDKELFAKLFEMAELAGKDEIRLMDQSKTMPLLVAEKTDDDYLVFTLPEGAEENSDWLPAFVLSLYENDLGIYFSVETYSFSEEDGAIATGYVNPEIRQEIEDNYPVSFISAEGLNLKVSLDLAVNEDFPQTMVDVAKELYSIVDFENSDFDTLSIYFIEELDEERARIFFRKHYATVYSGLEAASGYAYVHGIFQGGRLERDREAFMTLIAEDEFFRELNKTEEGMLFFD